MSHETSDLARVAMVHALCAAIDTARGLAATNQTAERRAHQRVYSALIREAEDVARGNGSADPRGFATWLYAGYRRMTTAGCRARARYTRPKVG